MPATVVSRTGPVSYTVETSDQLIWRRHVDQLLHSSGSFDESLQPPPFVPELENNLKEHQAPETPQKQLSDMDTISETSRLAQVTTPDITFSGSGLTPSDKVADFSEGRIYPKRDRRPPDRLSL